MISILRNKLDHWLPAAALSDDRERLDKMTDPSCRASSPRLLSPQALRHTCSNRTLHRILVGQHGRREGSLQRQHPRRRGAGELRLPAGTEAVFRPTGNDWLQLQHCDKLDRPGQRLNHRRRIRRASGDDMVLDRHQHLCPGRSIFYGRDLFGLPSGGWSVQLGRHSGTAKGG